MATTDPTVSRLLGRRGGSTVLAGQWRRLGRAATVVAVLTAPVAFVWFHSHNHWSLGWALLATIVTVMAFRGLVDVTLRRFIPWPSLFGAVDTSLKDEDVTNRRRAWFWRRTFRFAFFLLAIVTIVYLFNVLSHGADSTTWPGAAGTIFGKLGNLMHSSQLWIQVMFIFFLFFANILMFMGPMMMMGVSQIRGFEPGDADWGVRLEHVRGQAEAKEEVRRIVELWQSGEAFERAGGKRERGILFFGAPGTGKTMLAKAIATGFNCPFVTIPGSGFAQAFMGIDALIVRYLAWKARRLAHKWGGQCIVFIDEIDAVGMRRSSLGQGKTNLANASIHDFCFFGDAGALTSTGDLILENREWRERLFELREPPRRPIYPPVVERVGKIVNQMFPGGMMGGGQLALNQLLVVMDGIDNPPFWTRFWTNRVNSILDASYILPPRLGKVRLRLPRPRPRSNQIYFIGATNVPLEMLDPALRRPGRMGRHVWFRTPTKDDRQDIFDLYLARVSHDPDLDTEKRREELARITNGYSPAMIEQVCSMALTHAHHDARERFGWDDITEAMTTIESGTAIGQEYVPEEKRATAIHEAGHAVAAHAYARGMESTRLSIRRRGTSGGHHQAYEKEERFAHWRSEELAYLIWVLGAMAAERVFYGENTTGVGGDVQMVTAKAALMVGAAAMAPERVELNGRFESEEAREEARARIMKRFQEIGAQIMNLTGGGPQSHDPLASVLMDRDKRVLAAQLLGQAYIAAHLLIEHNKEGVERVAEAVMEKYELYGDELLELLQAQNFQIPEVDLTDEAIWPKL